MTQENLLERLEQRLRRKYPRIGIEIYTDHYDENGEEVGPFTHLDLFFRDEMYNRLLIHTKMQRGKYHIIHTQYDIIERAIKVCPEDFTFEKIMSIFEYINNEVTCQKSFLEGHNPSCQITISADKILSEVKGKTRKNNGRLRKIKIA